MKNTLLLFFCCLNFLISKSQISYTWNGSTSTAWNTGTNWTPAGVPGSADNVTIVTGANNCNLAGNTSVTNITFTSGTFNLGGFIFSVSGNAVFSAGTVNNGQISVNASTSALATLAGTTFNANTTLTIITGAVTVNGGTYNGPVTLEQTGATQTTGTGNAVFNGVTIITNSGTNNLRTNGNMTFNGTTTLNNTGTAYLLLELNTGNTYNATLNLNNTSGVNNLRCAYSGTTNFNGNIIMSNTGGANIVFGEQSNAIANLNAGFTISNGGLGFNSGRLYLQRFRQNGTTAQTLNFTGTSGIYIQSNSMFNGALNVTVPTISGLSTSTFNAAFTLSKTGSSNDPTSGGNVFNSTLTVNHSGTGYFSFGNGIKDIFNGDLYLNNTSAGERIIIGHNSVNNEFNGNIYLTSSGGAQGIDLGFGGNAPVAIFAAGKTVIVNPAGYTAGYIKLYRTVQSDATPLVLNTTGSSRVTLQENAFTGAVTVTSPDIYPQGGTYNGPAFFTKTGGTSDHNGTYQNTFNSTLRIDQQSNTGYFMLGYNSADLYNDNITVSSSGSGGIYLGWTNGVGTPSLAAGKTILTGPSGFSAGFLQLNRFTQLGSAAMNFTFTGDNTSLTFANNSVINGNLTASLPNVYFSGATFNGIVNCIKTSSVNNSGTGGNIFNAPSTFTNAGGGILYFGTSSADTWNSTVEFTCIQANSRIHPCWNAPGNLFNGNITLNSTNSASGIQIGGGGVASSSTLSSGSSIQVGSAGFSAGYLNLQRFTQLGPVPVDLTLSPTANYFSIGPNCTINANFSVNAPSINNLYQSVFNGSVSCVKTNSVNDACSGGNIFNGVTTFTNSGSGIFYLGNGSPDVFNADAEFTSNGGSRISPAWNSNGNLFNGNIIINSTGSATGIYFCGGSSLATATLASGKTLLTGSAGFSAGYLILPRFTQLGTAPVTLSLSPTANYFSIGPNSSIGGNFSVTAPSMNNINQSVFNGSATFIKTGAASDACTGGNTFNGASSFTNSGSGYFLLGNTAADTWNADVEFTNIGTERILPCWNSTGNLFNGNITVNSNGPSTGIHFCGGSPVGTATLAAGKTMLVGSAGITSGYLILQRFTQLGTTPVSLSLSPTSNYFSIGPNSAIGGNFSVTAPSLNNFNQSFFNGTVFALKTGSAGDTWTGGNTFNGPSSFTNTGSGNLQMGNSIADVWNADVEFTSTGASRISPAWGAAGNLFNGNITVNSSSVSTGIYLCGGNVAATATLAAGKTIQVGSGGYTNGYLILSRFTQLGSAPINLGLSPTANYFTMGPNSSIGGNFTVTAPSINSINQSTFNATSDFIKTGGVSDQWTGGNSFIGASSFSNSGTAYMGMGWTLPDSFNDVTFTCTGPERILPGWVAQGNLFNGNITVNSYSSSVGISFCGSTGTATMSAGKTVSVGTLGFSSGYLILRRFTQLGNAAVNLSLSPSASYIQYGPNSAFGGNVVSTSPGLLFNGAVFSGSVNTTKYGSGNDQGGGTNIFNGPAVFTQSGSGYLMMGNGAADQFNNKTEFNNTGSGNMHIAYNSGGNVFNGRVRFNNLPVSTGAVMYVASYSVNNSTFNDSIVVANVNGGGVQFGSNSGTSTLSAGNKICVGTQGFDSNTLLFRNFTQLGTTVQSFTTTGSSIIQYGPFCSFNGNLVTASPGLLFSGGTFNGIVTCTKNGAGNNSGSGPNVFNAPVFMTNSGTGYLMFGNTTGDQFNSASTFNNTGSNHIYVGWNSPGNFFGGPVTLNNTPTSTGAFINMSGNSVDNSVFNGNIIVNNINGAGISFGSANGTATLTAGNSISVGTTGFNAGYLTIRNFTQTGSTQQSLTTTGSSNIQYGPACSFDGNIISASPGLFFNGGVFNSTVVATKNGGGNDAGSGGNIFNAPVFLTSSGSGQLITGNGLGDQFNSTSVFNNTGSAHMYIANNSSGNVFGGRARFNNTPALSNVVLFVANANPNNSTFNDSIVVNCVNGAGVQFGATAGGSTLTAGKFIGVGASGFNSGTLLLRNFIQVGPSSQTLTTTGTSILQYGPASAFGGNVTSTSPGLLFNGCNFNGSTTCFKTGSTNDAGTGANIFNGPSVMTNSGNGYLMFSNGSGDQFNASAIFNNTGASHMYIAYNAANNVFNGPVAFNNTPASTGSFIYVASYVANNSTFNNNITVNNVNGNGIYFGTNTGTSTLTAGNTLSVGASGFNSGTLNFRNFTQTGATAQNINTTGSSIVQFGPACSFDGNITSVSPGVLFNGGTYNGIVSATKNGATNDQSTGGNIFNNIASFIDNGAGYLMLANTGSDAYNSDVNFTQNSTGAVYPNYNLNCTYSGNIFITSPAGTAITFGASNGTSEFTGGAAQNINKSGSTAIPVFRRLTMSKSSNTLTLNTRINIPVSLTLNTGIISTSSVNLLVLNNAATTGVGNAASYIDGPMNFDMALNGTRTLNFPVGKGADWRPATIAVTHNNATSYTYNSEVFNASAHALGWTLPPSVTRVSFVHYWDIQRLLTSSGAVATSANLSGNQVITLYYGNNDGVGDPANLVVCKNTSTAPTTWINIGGAGATTSVGTVASTSAPSAFNSFSRFTLGNGSGGTNILPVELLSFTARAADQKVILDWSTASEKNNYGFDLEKSRDGILFEKFAVVKALGNGNSLTQQMYATEDPNPYEGLSYYRLKQVDNSGTFKYAPVVSVNMTGNIAFEVYPNPVNSVLSIKVNAGFESAEVCMVSALGNTVLPYTTLGALDGSIDVSGFAAGVYYLVFKNIAGIRPLKVVVE